MVCNTNKQVENDMVKLKVGTKSELEIDLIKLIIILFKSVFEIFGSVIIDCTSLNNEVGS